jgi:hypothetical protein
MTSSTLYGIYDEMGASTATDTPWGVGAETPGVNYAANPAFDGATDLDRDGGNGENLENTDGELRIWSKTRSGVRLRYEAKNSTRRGVWKFMAIFGKLLSLFAFGATYGVIVSHLHDTRQLSAVQVGGVDHQSWRYMTGWGLAGLLLGILLPYIDFKSAGDADGNERSEKAVQKEMEASPSLGEQWNEVVRSVGAFVGIAFAIVSPAALEPGLSYELSC